MKKKTRFSIACTSTATLCTCMEVFLLLTLESKCNFLLALYRSKPENIKFRFQLSEDLIVEMLVIVDYIDDLIVIVIV